MEKIQNQASSGIIKDTTNKTSLNTKNSVENMLELKNKIIAELNRTDFPNLKFIFSEEVLDISLDLLKEFLKKDREVFEKQLLLKNEELNFDILFNNKDENDNLSYFWSLLNHLSLVNDSEKIRDIIEKFEEDYTAYSDFIGFNNTYYNQIIYIKENCELDEEQARIVDETIKGFKLKGIDLSKNSQDKIKKINIKLGELSTKFGNNCLDSEGKYEFLVTDFEIIKDLPKETLEIAKNKAMEKNISGWLFDADPTAYFDLLTYCSDSKVREKLYKDKHKFSSEGKSDNRGIILEVLQLKQKKSLILGYKNYAENALQTKMVKNPKEVIDLIEGIAKKAKNKANQEIEELKKYFKLDSFESWDLYYYQNKLKNELYDIDEKELKKYFKFEDVLSYMFDFVSKFYSLNLKEIKIPIYDNDVKVFEVYRKNKFISYFLLDPFYRKEKKSGAWADNIRSKDYSGLGKRESIIANCCNFQKQTDSDILLTMNDVETLFHEFGHALHEMLSESKYSSLSGFGVEQDFVELPSQIHESWVTDKESLKLLSKHHLTGESLSDEILEKLETLKTFSSGNHIIRQNEFALLDMMLYILDEIPETIEKLDKLILDFTNKIGVFHRGEEYKFYANFRHIFGGGYAAGYYGYMWADILVAQAWEKIKENGVFNPEIGEKFISTILGQGCRKDAIDMFKDFTGEEINPSYFMKDYGLQN